MKWKKLLLTDDIELLTELEQSFIQRESFVLLVAQNDQDVYSMTALERPDLILLNLDMPEIKGDDCCKRIKLDNDLSDIPVILVIPDRTDKSIWRCREALCNDFLVKPFDHLQVVEKVAHFLKVQLRAEPRVETCLSIRYGTANQQQLTNFSVNMSTGGVFIETGNPLPVDTLLTISFTLPDSGKELQCQGRVAWVNVSGQMVTTRLPIGMGIQFHNLSMDKMYALRDYIKKISQQPIS